MSHKLLLYNFVGIQDRIRNNAVFRFGTASHTALDTTHNGRVITTLDPTLYTTLNIMFDSIGKI